MVFNFQNGKNTKIVENYDADQYLLQTVGKEVVKLQKQSMKDLPEWFGPESVFFNFPSNIAVFPVYNGVMP